VPFEAPSDQPPPVETIVGRREYLVFQKQGGQFLWAFTANQFFASRRQTALYGGCSCCSFIHQPHWPFLAVRSDSLFFKVLEPQPRSLDAGQKMSPSFSLGVDRPVFANGFKFTGQKLQALREPICFLLAGQRRFHSAGVYHSFRPSAYRMNELSMVSPAMLPSSPRDGILSCLPPSIRTPSLLLRGRFLLANQLACRANRSDECHRGQPAQGEPPK
jgi:hypothetical protein